MQKQEILLESGTNEMELLTFLLGDQLFGVNVSKVQSIVQYDPSSVTKIPEAPPAMLGMLLYRRSTIPLIDLAVALELEISVSSEKQIVIVTEFNNSVSSYRVDGVKRIHRLSWNDFVPMDSFFSNSETTIIGSVHIDETEAMIVDMEHILAKIVPSLSIEEVSINTSETVEILSRENVRIYFAEDSMTVRNQVIRTLSRAGYKNIHAFKNGQEAYEMFDRLKDQVKAKIPSPKLELPHVLISDIEMPKMDGLTLCRKIKKELGLSQIPIIMFSSLINDQMISKCESVGADDYISKPEMNKLISILDQTCLTA